MEKLPNPVEESDLENPWFVCQAFYPSGASLEKRLRFILNYALLSPSSHNSQPWLFALNKSKIELYADRSRALPVVDPQDRELLISCGSSLYFLQLALRHFGFSLNIETVVSKIPQKSALLAVIHFHEKGSSQLNPDEEKLFKAVPNRTTNRNKFENTPVPQGVLETVKESINRFNCWIHLADDLESKRNLVKMISEGDKIQWQNKTFRQELSNWIHPNYSNYKDGLPGYSQGMGDFVSYFAPLVVRTFDLGGNIAAKDEELSNGSPILAILGTTDDTPLDWFTAGQSLAELLLILASHGISASFMNQPIEVKELRTQLGEMIGKKGYPQMLMRMGYGPSVRRTPRRPVKEVVKEFDHFVIT
jgi:hypothetical protein